MDALSGIDRPDRPTAPRSAEAGCISWPAGRSGSQRAGLDLSAIGRHRQIGDGGILGLARAVAHHRLVGGAVRGIDCIQCFRQRTDLVHLDENGVGRLPWSMPRFRRFTLVTNRSSPTRFTVLADGRRSAPSSRPSHLRPCRPRWRRWVIALAPGRHRPSTMPSGGKALALARQFILAVLEKFGGSRDRSAKKHLRAQFVRRPSPPPWR